MSHCDPGRPYPIKKRMDIWIQDIKNKTGGDGHRKSKNQQINQASFSPQVIQQIFKQAQCFGEYHYNFHKILWIIGVNVTNYGILCLTHDLHSSLYTALLQRMAIRFPPLKKGGVHGLDSCVKIRDLRRYYEKEKA